MQSNHDTMNQVEILLPIIIELGAGKARSSRTAPLNSYKHTSLRNGLFGPVREIWVHLIHVILPTSVVC